jgi:hypothetical protein
LQTQALRRQTQGRQLHHKQQQQQQQQQLPLQSQQHLISQVTGKAGSMQQLPAELPAAAAASRQQQPGALAPPARSVGPTAGPTVFVSFVPSNRLPQQQRQKAQQRRRTDGGLLPYATGSAAVAGVEMTPLQRANLALKIGGGAADTGWRQQQQQPDSTANATMPAFLRAFLNQQQQQQQQPMQGLGSRQLTKSAEYTAEQRQRHQSALLADASRDGVADVSPVGVVEPAGRDATLPAGMPHGSNAAVHNSQAAAASTLHMKQRHSMSTAAVTGHSGRPVAAAAGGGGGGGSSSRHAAVSVSQPQLPQLAALRVAAEAGAQSVAGNIGGSVAAPLQHGQAAGLLPAILSRSM